MSESGHNAFKWHRDFTTSTNPASCVDFICFGSKFRQNYRLWHLAHRKTRKKQGPSTCRAPAKKTLVIGSCMLPFLAIWFLYVGLTRSWFRLLGSCNMLSTMGHWFARVSISCLGLTGTWFRLKLVNCKALSTIGHWFWYSPGKPPGGDPSHETYVLVL